MVFLNSFLHFLPHISSIPSFCQLCLQKKNSGNQPLFSNSAVIIPPPASIIFLLNSLLANLTMSTHALALVPSSQRGNQNDFLKHKPSLPKHIWCLGLEDSLEEGMATHSSILIWRISWTGEPGGL